MLTLFPTGDSSGFEKPLLRYSLHHMANDAAKRKAQDAADESGSENDQSDVEVSVAVGSV